MIDFFASITVATIAVMTLIMLLANYRQARAFRELRAVFEDWYQAFMRDRKERKRDELQITDPIEWFSSHAELKLIQLHRIIENPPALEFITAESMRLVVSKLGLDDLKKKMRKIRLGSKKSSRLVEPLLGNKLSKIKTHMKGFENAGEWFDVEAEAALRALGVDWGCIEQLYFYLIPIQTEPKKSLIRVDRYTIKQWFTTVGLQIKKWIRQFTSKSAS